MIELETFVGQNQEKITNIYTGRRIVLVDFDGVIHSYKSGWLGVDKIPDHPVKGAFGWLTEMVEHFDVRIFSARCNDTAGVVAMIKWFRKWQLPEEVLQRLGFEPGKPSAFALIDDRAIAFAGSFAGLGREQLGRFVPWYYSHEAWNRVKEPST